MLSLLDIKKKGETFTTRFNEKNIEMETGLIKNESNQKQIQM